MFIGNWSQVTKYFASRTRKKEMAGIGQESIIFILALLVENISLTTLARLMLLQVFATAPPFNSRIAPQNKNTPASKPGYFYLVEMAGIEPACK